VKDKVTQCFYVRIVRIVNICAKHVLILFIYQMFSSFIKSFVYRSTNHIP